MSNPSSVHQKDITIGIIMLDTVFPRIKGDVGNAETFSFPVIYKVVKGASPQKVVLDADPALLPTFIDAARELVNKGARAISTSCGFLAIFHRELVNALDVPVYTSSLLQVHLARTVIREDRKVGIITARKQSLTEKHLSGVGIRDFPLAIIGMEEAEEFSATFVRGKPTLDVEKCRREMEAAAIKLQKSHPDIGAIVLECTNMPPFADVIRSITGLPVFDVVTMLDYAHSTLARRAGQL